MKDYKEAVSKIEKVIDSCKTDEHVLTTLKLIGNFRRLYVSFNKKDKKMYDKIVQDLLSKLSFKIPDVVSTV